MKMQNLNDLLVAEMRDIYDAEKRLVATLPKLAKTVDDRDLSQAFAQHLEQTKVHVERLEKAFTLLGEKASRKACKGMKGLLEEGEEFLKAKSLPPGVRDAALISAAQRVEHYEIAGYGCLVAMAKLLELDEVADLLEQTLMEEKETDARLSSIAEDSVNIAAKNAQ